jgi:hypothetical protein
LDDWKLPEIAATAVGVEEEIGSSENKQKQSRIGLKQ